MCEFPSWIVDDKGKAWFAKDKDIARAIEDGRLRSWEDATGHTALERMFGVSGAHSPLSHHGFRFFPQEFP